jgi:hypothetical protein
MQELLSRDNITKISSGNAIKNITIISRDDPKNRQDVARPGNKAKNVFLSFCKQKKGFGEQRRQRAFFLQPWMRKKGFAEQRRSPSPFHPP